MHRWERCTTVTDGYDYRVSPATLASIVPCGLSETWYRLDRPLNDHDGEKAV